MRTHHLSRQVVAVLLNSFTIENHDVAYDLMQVTGRGF